MTATTLCGSPCIAVLKRTKSTTMLTARRINLTTMTRTRTRMMLWRWRRRPFNKMGNEEYYKYIELNHEHNLWFFFLFNNFFYYSQIYCRYFVSSMVFYCRIFSCQVQCILLLPTPAHTWSRGNGMYCFIIPCRPKQQWNGSTVVPCCTQKCFTLNLSISLIFHLLPFYPLNQVSFQGDSRGGEWVYEKRMNVSK